MASSEVETGTLLKAPPSFGSSKWASLALTLGPFVLLIALRPLLPEWALVWPADWAVPFEAWLNAIVAFLKDTKVFIWFTFKDLTRAIATVVESGSRA